MTAKIPKVLLVMKPVDGGAATIGIIEYPHCGETHYTTLIKCGERDVFCGTAGNGAHRPDGYSTVDVEKDYLDMPAMIDVSCPKCGRRFGWSGNMVDRPPCPKCGHRPPQAELEAADKEMNDFAERLLTHPNNASLAMRRQQRIDAGLTLRQAAKLLGITPSTLSDVEWGRADPNPGLLEEMAKLYGVGGELT